jgi:hypothetical protein
MKIQLGRWYKIEFTTGEDWAYILILSNVLNQLGYIKVPLKEVAQQGWRVSVGHEEAEFHFDVQADARIMPANFRPKVHIGKSIARKAIKILWE